MTAPATVGPLWRSARHLGALAAAIWLLLLASPWPAVGHVAAAVALLFWGHCAWSTGRGANAALEASAANERRAVATIMAEHVEHETAGLHDEIDRVRTLLADAVDGLGQSFELLRVQAYEQRALVQELVVPTEPETSGVTPEAVRRANEQAEQIDRAVADAVRHLQFEDLVAQSLEPLRAIGDRLNTLGPQAKDILALSANAGEDAQVLRESLAATRATSRARARRSVAQGSMAAGEVELF